MKNYILIEDALLKNYNSMRVNSKCKILILPLNTDGIIEAEKDYFGRNIVFLGKGSDIILSKEYYGEEYIFISTILVNDIRMENEKIVAQCGATMSALSWFALEQSKTGFEFMEDIPGTVGGGINMNAGTYKDTIGQIADTIIWYSPKNDRIDRLKVEGSVLQKRSVVFPEKDAIVLEVIFNTADGDYQEILDKMLAVKKDRYTKQPRNYPSAGSVFKRPEKNGELLQVWQLIEKSGLRGFSIGDAQVSEKHTGFIVNKGNATGKELLDVAEMCKKTVKEKFDIDLELEWKII